jgi:hypothetical protein
VKKLEKQFDIGVRWLRCGWRLLQRNPYSLLGMGFVCMLIIIALTLIPLFGNTLSALMLPIFMSSAMLVADDLSKLKMGLPASLRRAALTRSPKDLFKIFGKEEHLVPALVLCVYVMGAALVTTIVAHVVTGGTWASTWASLNIVGVLQVSMGWLVTLLLYFLVAASLVYAIPLAFLKDQPLVPALGRSLMTSAKNLIALAVIFGLLIVPFLLGNVALLFSAPAGYLIWLLGGAIILPLTVTSCYCSYRTAFPTTSPAET